MAKAAVKERDPAPIDVEEEQPKILAEPTNAGSVSIYQQFEQELDSRAEMFASMLPSTVTPARFRNTVVAAVRQDPTIFQASIRSIMAAVIRAAQDGLVPDGREGHIAVYNVNTARRGQPEKWEKRAQWNPMAHGLRKRLRELDGIIANSEVVHESDHFIWHQGDEPKIEHEPARLGQDRGKMIGAYCIYKREDGTILHREVMDCVQIEMTRNQSKAKDSLMWTKFVSEGYRKSVLRRGIKTVPVGDTMKEIIRRDDDDNFAFASQVAPAAPVLAPPPAPPPSQKIKETVIAAVTKAKSPEPPPAAPGAVADHWTDYFELQKGELAGAKTAHEKHVINETVHDSINGAVERGELSDADAELLRAKWDEVAI